MEERFNLYRILLGTDFIRSTDSLICSNKENPVWRYRGISIYYTYFPDNKFKYLAIYDSNNGSIIYFQIQGKGGIQGKKDFIETINKRYK